MTSAPAADGTHDGVGRQDYLRRVAAATPRSNVVAAMARAFAIGGGICVVGQVVLEGLRALGLDDKAAAAPLAVVMVGLGSLFTAFGLYDRLAKVAGMGAALPITGFSNSMTAPAMEHKREGFVLGLGSSMFSVAGPVLVYGFAAAWLCASAAWVLGRLGVRWGIGG
jgi:stage V sporulation protein AC